MSETHSALPWRAKDTGTSWHLIGSKDEWIATIHTGYDSGKVGDQDYIVRACNTLPGLVEAASMALSFIDANTGNSSRMFDKEPELAKRLRAEIAKAEGSE